MVRKQPAHARLRDWTAHIGTQHAAAMLLGCDRSTLANIIAGRRLPGRALATSIAYFTEEWHRGPIAVAEWTGVQNGTR